MMRALGAWIACLVLVACATPDSDGSESTRNESGVRREVALDSVFTLTGQEAGLSFADPDLVAEQRNGDLVLVDRHYQHVAIHDSTGRVKVRFGRRGQGPDEFNDVEGVFSLPGDTIMVFDRTRQIGYLYHQYKATGARIDFREWRFTEKLGQLLLGRFADGRWVASLGEPLPLVTQGVRVGSDSVHLLAGLPDAAPTRFASVAEVRQVDLLTEGNSYRFDLNEIAPGAGAVCESGVVLSDTTGVRRLSVDGQTASFAAHPFPRIPIEQFGGIDGIVESRTSILAPGTLAEKARAALKEAGQNVDSVMSAALIDARGIVWYTRPGAKRGNAFALYADGKELQERFLAPGAYRIGSRFLLTWSSDPELEVPRYTAFRVGSSVSEARTGLGWCYGQFRW
jgi:hypothetical protein